MKNEMKKFKLEKKFIYIAILFAALGVTLIFISDDKGEAGKAETDITFGTLSSELEEKVRRLCESVDGVNNVNVMLTLDTSEEYVYAKNNESSESYSKNTYVTLTGDDGAVELYVISPKVRGVAVVCRGGDNGEIRIKLTELISAALGIPTSRISIAGGG